MNTLFHDRNRTLLPRIDTIFLLTRIMVISSLVWLVFVHGMGEGEQHLFYYLIGAFAAFLGIFGLGMLERFDLKLAYLSTIVFDTLAIPLIILYTGEVYSPYFLVYFLTISASTYLLTFWYSFGVIVLITIGFLISSVTGLTLESMFDLVMRAGFLWVFYLALLYASDYMRRSEKRLLGLFNTLNRRTAELEKSQAHLAMIYDHSRTLAGILDADSVVKEVMRILGTILGYRAFAIVFMDRAGNFLYRARSTGGQNNYHLKAISHDDAGLIRRVAALGDPTIIRSLRGRDDIIPLDESTQSMLLVPMLAHGSMQGVLIAEAAEADRFHERDQQMLSVVARSAGLALENAELHRRTEELTLIDELTETYNYRYFVQKLQEEKRRAVRYRVPLSLIMVDIDWFKKLNDSYGHESGNLVLRELSRIIKKCIRDVDIFVRYGGEEFAIILPQTTLSEARVIGERIRDQVEQAGFKIPGYDPLHITVSVGVTSFPENGKTEEELVSIADQALYRAKGEGRNLVCSI